MSACATCDGTGRDAKHRDARFMRMPDGLDCSICGDHGWDWTHGDGPDCDGEGAA